MASGDDEPLTDGGGGGGGRHRADEGQATMPAPTGPLAARGPKAFEADPGKGPEPEDEPCSPDPPLPPPWNHGHLLRRLEHGPGARPGREPDHGVPQGLHGLGPLRVRPGMLARHD